MVSIRLYSFIFTFLNYINYINSSRLLGPLFHSQVSDMCYHGAFPSAFFVILVLHFRCSNKDFKAIVKNFFDMFICEKFSCCNKEIYNIVLSYCDETHLKQTIYFDRIRVYFTSYINYYCKCVSNET